MTCDCPYPIKQRIGDVFVRKTEQGYITVHRYCDCLFCGPSSMRVNIMLMAGEKTSVDAPYFLGFEHDRVNNRLKEFRHLL